ncbi:hypothetical protein DKX38_013192 [Salix brachista]|uniref:Uncharacterized protein n=1 Tax=Salix brachista TaxID=2182728 RepID=A0A5N5LQY8_9ROSI|nr:hypothetical protein DKX38_013192 [Salix brachista]
MYVKNLMGLSGLFVREDAVGMVMNQALLQLRLVLASMPLIPYAWKYGGVVGVLGEIEAINMLKRLAFSG